MSKPAKERIENFPVVIEVPVAWGEMDAFAHLNNVVYFRYFESARIAYFNRMQILSASATPAGIGPILASTSCRFKAPVTYPDNLRIGCRVGTVEHDRFEMIYLAHSEQLGRTAAVGDGLIVSYDYDTGRKAPLPKKWSEAIRKIEHRDI